MSIKIAEANIYEIGIEESLIKSLEDTPEDELDEVRDNIIHTLLATREGSYLILLRYFESEEFFDTENYYLLLPRPTLESFSIPLTANINPYFFDYNQNNNQTSTKTSEDEEGEMEEGVFVIYGVDVENPFIGDLKGAI